MHRGPWRLFTLTRRSLFRLNGLLLVYRDPWRLLALTRLGLFIRHILVLVWQVPRRLSVDVLFLTSKPFFVRIEMQHIQRRW